ncbi:MAG: response regulator [Deltaproteobacteria bacterium]|nr:response regulator [Deltaproteobacteria bacterium]
MTLDPAKILVVEDESGMRTTLVANLEEAGYRVIGCNRGRDAMRYVENDAPDVVIADLRLPDGSGLEILESLKEIKPEASFILVTGYASLETAVAALNQGAYAYISKPFNMDEVHATIRNAIRQQRLLLENQRLVENLQLTNKNLGEEVSERKRAEEALAERSAALEAANKELEAFSYSVSHDLRAPLRSIDGFSQALLEDYVEQLDEQGKDYLTRIRTASQRMGHLIDDLLNLSRVTRAEMRPEPVNLSEMAKSLAAELKQREPQRQVAFQIQDGLEVKGDPRLLRVVLENLFSNAWKFTSRHPRARIEFGAAQHNGKPTYFVRDDGAGFDMAYKAKLFGAFQRLHKATEFDGTGVGLATVQRIIRRHGGEIWAEAEVEKGATFYFTL